MIPVRVLVVDDSVVVRRIVGDALAQAPGIEVAGTAANGRIALAKLDQVNPDLVTLDVEMPELDGLDTLVEIRKRRPRLPVIMFSTRTERGAAITIEALSRGASDYVTKPANVGGVTAAIEAVRTELVPKIKLLCPRLEPATSPAPPRPLDDPGGAAAPARGTWRPSSPPRVLTIGASTGGPNALTEVLTHLPADLPVPVVVVQHMPPLFTSLLADRLTKVSPLTVAEGVAGARLEPGRVFIAPGSHHMVVEQTGDQIRLGIHDGPPENSCRPAVDVLFRSVAEVYGAATLAVVLTGMGEDGLRGARQIHAAGGRILAQDEATSVVWGMPGAVTRAGVVDRVLPLDAVAPEIVRHVGAVVRTGRP